MTEVAQNCVDCGKAAPETASRYTLISAEHGWRLTRSVLPGGGVQLAWRCPSCWQAFKQKTTTRAPATSSPGLKAPVHTPGAAHRTK